MNWKSLRKKVFRGNYPLNQELIALAKTEKSHRFLANQATLFIYTYLAHYVKAFSEQWFDSNHTLKILDWGTGKGQIAFLMKEIYPEAEILSCDIEEESHSHGDSSFRQSTPIIEKMSIEVIPLQHEFILPFDDNSLDVVLSFGVLEHVPNDAASLREINRVLKPRGLLFCFFLPYQLSWTQKLAHWRGNFYHDRLYAKQQTRTMLRQAKFKPIDMWHRQLLPKNSIQYRNYRFYEHVDQFLTEYTPARYLATDIEFVAYKV